MTRNKKLDAALSNLIWNHCLPQDELPNWLPILPDLCLVVRDYVGIIDQRRCLFLEAVKMRIYGFQNPKTRLQVYQIIALNLGFNYIEVYRSICSFRDRSKIEYCLSLENIP